MQLSFVVFIFPINSELVYVYLCKYGNAILFCIPIDDINLKIFLRSLSLSETISIAMLRECISFGTCIQLFSCYCRLLRRVRRGKQLMSMITFHTSILVPLISPGNSMATTLVTLCYLETMIQHHQNQSLDHTGSIMGRSLELFWRVEVLKKTRLLPKLQESSLLLIIWIC